MRVNADHGRDLPNVTKGEICERSAFPCLLLLMFDETLSNQIVCLMISHKKLLAHVAEKNSHAAVDTR